jgi:hypothetical protein
MAAIFSGVATVMIFGTAPAASAQSGDYQYIRAAGNVRCVVSADRAACERMSIEGFSNAPANPSGGRWRVAMVNADGNFSWAESSIGESTGLEVAANRNPSKFHGWAVLAAPDGTRLTNVVSYHGMLVSNDGASVTPY